MEYELECYKNTGFNVVNIPESLDWLRANYTAVNLPAVNLLQNEGLTNVNVATSWNEIKDVDYIVIGDECYMVDGVPVMTSNDVAALNLIPDELTTLGGAGSLSYLDGITERHTVAEDNLFEYSQDDELMAPMQALKLETTDMLFTGSDTTVAVESTIDLQSLGEEFDDSGNFTGKGLTFTDTTSGESVIVPYTGGVSARTNYQLGDDATNNTLSPNTRLYASGGDYAKINNALAAVRSLGTESALISQVAFPDNLVQSVIGNDGQYSSTIGKDQTEDSGLNFVYSDSVKNKRLFYGGYNKYGLVTASGDKAEYNPEQIGESGDTAPEVRSISDPRPDGKPYFRYAKYNGNTSLNGFFMASVAGLQWKSVPLTYTAPSNTYLDRLNFDSARTIASNNYAYTRNVGIANIAQTGIQGALNTAGAIASGVNLNPLTADTGKAAKAAFDAISSVEQTAYSMGIQTAALVHNRTQYQLGRDNELSNFAASQTAVAPEILFPFSADIIRDFIGNGVIAYRYRYSDSDLSRIDKILTMYGYKDSVPLTADLFNCREKFDYVQAHGVSIGGTSPRWKRDIATEQLNAGVRVWHVKPDVLSYSDNPIRSNS